MAKSKSKSQSLLTQERKRLKRSSKIHIGAAPALQRILKKSARRQQRREKAPSKFIMPWLHEPNYKYIPNQHHGAHLLSLPSELLQEILFLSLYGERQEKLRHRIGELNTVCPTIRAHMVYVSKAAMSLASDAEDSVSPPSFNEFPNIQWPILSTAAAAANFTANIYRDRFTGGKQIDGRLKKLSGRKRKNRKRWQKCWFCEERHLAGDQVCPMERRDPELWVQSTKVKRGAVDSTVVRIGGQMRSMMGKKTVFKG
ncbi:hypothetical protein CC80DRAFT_34663 [Byssothecium circinans]|uniref:Uncharacterized protein n=1 Tax=Byssothecium circinans TaxID=147558 RepID=A0A6A5U0L8_9PLEO|nr:hypothetical protein CC80DRAFT_34663 [Byssothecium circinans]